MIVGLFLALQGGSCGGEGLKGLSGLARFEENEGNFSMRRSRAS